VDRKTRNAIIVAAVIFVVILTIPLLRHRVLYPATDDGYVDANVVGIAAQVAGPIVELPLADNQPVSAGDLLFRIDPRPFEIAVDQARAELDRTGQDVTVLADRVVTAESSVRYAEAALQLARTQWKRIEPLAEIGAVPYQDRDKALASLDGARAQLDNAKAALKEAHDDLGALDENNPEIRSAVTRLENAELQLSYSKVVAPVNGLVTDLDVSPGDYVSIGSPILYLVNADSWHVVAYFKETQLARIRPSQPASVFLPAYRDVRFEGSVQGIGWGVEQQGGDGTRGSSGVPSVQPTVDWVRMAQRFPVRIIVANDDPEHPLRKGMRATVRIDTTAEVSGP